MKRSWHITPREIERLTRGEASASANCFCPKCRHAKFLHIDTGVGSHCVLCLFLLSRDDIIVPNKPTRQCNEHFVFRMSMKDRQEAVLKGNPMDFEQEEICGNCALYWMQHQGYLCPSGDTTFVKMFPQGKE